MELKLLKSIIGILKNECEDFAQHNVDVLTIEKTINNLDVAKDSGIDQISVKFLKDGDPVVAIYLVITANVSIKLDIFPSKCTIGKIKPLFKKGIKTEAKKMDCFTFIN